MECSRVEALGVHHTHSSVVQDEHRRDSCVVLDIGSNLESCRVPSKSGVSFTASQASRQTRPLGPKVSVQKSVLLRSFLRCTEVCIYELAEHPHAGLSDVFALDRC